MAKRIAINGFGRIGRLTLRNLLKMDNVEVVAINDLTDNATLAHLFKYDSTQGIFAGTVTHNDNSISINGKELKAYAQRNPAELPWADLNIDVVLECTGFFRTRDKAALHLQAGAKKVIISAPAKGGGVPTIVLGVNEDIIKAEDAVLSNASCTTNCLTPMVATLDALAGLVQGAVTTTHAYTGDQRLLDAPHSDLRRARAAAVNIVPTTTGAANALGVVLPKMQGRLLAMAVRVPTPTGSLTELNVMVEKEVTVEEVNAAFKAASENRLKGVLEYETAPVVSSDIVGNTHSCIFDSLLTAVNGKMVKIVGWYDNEAGYSARLADMVNHV